MYLAQLNTRNINSNKSAKNMFIVPEVVLTEKVEFEVNKTWIMPIPCTRM